MRYSKIFIVIIGLVILLAISETAFAQCSMCKSNLEMARKDGGTQVGNTLNNGILYLLVLPYAIAAVFGFIYYKKYKEKKAADKNASLTSI
jgi:hypothetical protein